MTVHELIELLIPLLLVGLLVIGIVFGIQLVTISIRIKKVIERIETISDVSGWLSMIRKWPSKKTKSQ